jgi:CoA:oxalate CoA-transferase
MPEQALSHLKVLEICSYVTGPYCTKLMADLGAEVVKTEPPGTGDEARRRGPFLDDIPDAERSGLFLHLNTNKLGITLDPETSTGRRILRELIRQTDVLVEDNAPARAEELGLSYGELEQINPRLVMTSITPFGQTGPYRDYKAYELNLYHAGGEGYLLPIFSKDYDREPVKGGGIVGDCICGLTACAATLSAVYLMQATGMGQHVDVSKQDVMMTLVQNHVCTHANTGEVHTRFEEERLTVLPVRCQDGYIMITIVSEREWANLARAMGNPEWVQDERFSTWAGRHLHAGELNPRIREWVAQFKKDEAFELLQASGVAAVPVATADDLARSAQLEARGFFSEIDRPLTGRQRYPTASYNYEKTPWQALRPAPLLGQHNEEVYCGRLGYDRETLVTMREAGVI